MDRARLAISHAPTVFAEIEEQKLAKGALEKVFADRISHMKLVPQAMSQMPLREADRFFNKGQRLPPTIRIFLFVRNAGITSLCMNQVCTYDLEQASAGMTRHMYSIE